MATRSTLLISMNYSATEPRSRRQDGQFYHVFYGVAPRECAYCDLRACCRHAANMLPKDAQGTERTS